MINSTFKRIKKQHDQNEVRNKVEKCKQKAIQEKAQMVYKQSQSKHSTLRSRLGSTGGYKLNFEINQEFERGVYFHIIFS